MLCLTERGRPVLLVTKGKRLESVGSGRTSQPMAAIQSSADHAEGESASAGLTATMSKRLDQNSVFSGTTPRIAL